MLPTFNSFADIPQGGALPFRPDAIYIGVGGNLTVQDMDGRTANFPVSAAQTLIVEPFAIVWATTTATGLVALRCITERA